MKIYEYDEQMADCLNEETGEFDLETFERLQMEKQAKLENLILYMKELKAGAEALGKEVATLQARKKACENKAERIKEFLLGYLAGEKFATSKVSVSYRTDKSVEIDDLSMIPAEFLKFTEPTADKVALKAALKEGTVEGCHLEEKRNMIIK